MNGQPHSTEAGWRWWLRLNPPMVLLLGLGVMDLIGWAVTR